MLTRRLPRTVFAVGLVLILVCAGLACGRPERPLGPRSETSSRLGEWPAAQVAAWVRGVPAAHLSAGASTPGSSTEGQRGTLLSSRWLGPDGAVAEADPRRKVVTWPVPLKLRAPAPLRLRVDMPQEPAKVDVRVFGGAIDDRGAPLDAGRVIECSEGPPDDGPCAYGPGGGGLDVVLREPPRRPAMRLVLYAEWYVPTRQRPAAAKANATVSASWGFAVTAEPEP